jgi:hypothetical protein
MIDAREQMKFEKWIEENYSNIMVEWELSYSEFMDLDQYVKDSNYIVWKKWLKEKDNKTEIL